MLRNLTIRRKLIIIMTVTSGITLLLASVGFILYDRYAFTRTMRRDLSILATVVGANSSAALVFNDRVDARETLEALRAEPHIISGALYDRSGVIFATFTRDATPVELPLRAPANPGYHFDKMYLQVVQQIVLDEEAVGTVVIQSDLDELQSRLRNFAGIVSLFLVFCMGIAVLVAARLQRIISIPIRDLAEIAKDVSSGADYSLRASKHGEDELGFLVEQFNDMLGQIQERDRELQSARDELEDRAQELQRELMERKRAEEERQRLEAQVQHAQRLESLGILAGGIAHDFNNLLTGMMGHAGLALEHLPEGSPAVKNIRQVELAAERAAELTAQMLAYSGRGQFVVELVSLSNVVRENVALLGTVISKKATLEYDLEENMPLVEVDVSQIRQVVMNLITNASDSLENGEGNIRLVTGTMEVDRQYLASCLIHDEVQPGRFAYLEVSDTGCGMDGELRRKIFDPFFSTKFAGRGLGLAAVQGIVRGHGGAIRVESQRGVGTTFRVLLPASEAEPPVEEVVPVVPIDDRAGTGTVLVVDDEEYVRLLVRTILEKRGYSVIMASNGREAVDLYSEQPSEIGLVLLDLTMPVMDGREAFAEILKIDADARIIISSGYSQADAVRQFDGGVPAAFIQKPYQPNLLASRVAEIIRH